MIWMICLVTHFTRIAFYHPTTEQILHNSHKFTRFFGHFSVGYISVANVLCNCCSIARIRFHWSDYTFFFLPHVRSDNMLNACDGTGNAHVSSKILWALRLVGQSWNQRLIPFGRFNRIRYARTHKHATHGCKLISGRFLYSHRGGKMIYAYELPRSTYPHFPQSITYANGL